MRIPLTDLVHELAWTPQDPYTRLPAKPFEISCGPFRKAIGGGFIAKLWVNDKPICDIPGESHEEIDAIVLRFGAALYKEQKDGNQFGDYIDV